MEVTFKTESEKDFPKLMINEIDKLIVYFTSNNVGNVLLDYHESPEYEFFYYSHDWNIKDFRDFNGTITIKN